MNKILLTTCVLAAVLVACSAQARDTREKYSIEKALNTPVGKEKIDPAIRLFWGAQQYPTPVQDFGAFVSNKKSNSFGVSDEDACTTAFLSSVISLQDRARSEGGNAVVNIHSYYKKDEFSSETEFECGAGGFVAGSALRGTVVKLP
jgi:hypothetical protein